eukprot:symbB.v1.2.036418.t1/scaffold5136.1/size30496/1
MPHSSYTLAEFNCYGNCGPDTVEILTGLAFKGGVVTTGQTVQSMCFATSLSTAKKILDTGLIPVELFTNCQVNNWFCPRSALLRSLQIYWSGHTDTLDVQEPMTLIIYNPGLERCIFLELFSLEKPAEANWRPNLQAAAWGPPDKPSLKSPVLSKTWQDRHRVCHHFSVSGRPLRKLASKTAGQCMAQGFSAYHGLCC